LIDNHHRQLDASREWIRDEIHAQLARQLMTTTLGPKLEAAGPATDLPRCSVVICTRDRAELLDECLDSVLALDYPDFEVVVVDNAPSDNATQTLASRRPVRYAREDRPGLDWARNRGLSASRGEIVAFVDDDARPDRGWLRAIAAAFADPEVMAVGGMVAPRELETRAQMLFELELGGMTQGLTRRTIRAAHSTARDLLWVSSFAVGTNMAYRRSVFDHVGGFDPALDVGTATGSGGDLEMCHRLVARGHTMVYEPAAVVWHVHRRTLLGLERQLHANGLGFGSYLLTCARNGTVGRLSIIRFALAEWLWGWILKRLFRPGDVPRRLVWAELLGALRSPLAYRKAHRQARRLAQGSGTRAPGGELRLAEGLTEREG
jgi:glycosyltransferase involved in cell wall biosynthesis